MSRSRELRELVRAGRRLGARVLSDARDVGADGWLPRGENALADELAALARAGRWGALRRRGASRVGGELVQREEWATWA